MTIDFGAGLSVDELIGWPVYEIAVRKLPRGKEFNAVGVAAATLLEGGFGNYILMELWGDGHSVWRQPKTGQTLLFTPTGQVIYHRD